MQTLRPEAYSSASYAPFVAWPAPPPHALESCTARVFWLQLPLRIAFIAEATATNDGFSYLISLTSFLYWRSTTAS